MVKGGFVVVVALCVWGTNKLQLPVKQEADYFLFSQLVRK